MNNIVLTSKIPKFILWINSNSSIGKIISKIIDVNTNGVAR